MNMNFTDRTRNNWRLKQRLIKELKCNTNDMNKKSNHYCRTIYNELKNQKNVPEHEYNRVVSLYLDGGKSKKSRKSRRFRKTKRSRKTRRR